MKPIAFNLDLSTVRVDFTDERLGLPSASGANILAHCPGAWRMQHGRPDIGRFKGDADLGTRKHRALAGDQDVDLDAEALADVRQMEDNCQLLLAEWQAKTQKPGEVLRVELASADADRLHLRSGVTPITTGRFDRLYFQVTDAGVRRRALLVDFKSGWQELGTTGSNMQLLVYALLVVFEEQQRDALDELEAVDVAIVRPQSGKPYWHSYNDTNIESARQLWERVLRESFGESPALVAGSHCTFCKAQDICPARRAQLATFKVDADALAAKWELMEPTAKYELYVASRSVAQLCDVIKDRVKEDMQRENAIPGLYWKPGAVNKVITDADKALSRVLSNGGTREDFLAGVTVSFAKLRDTLAAKLGWKKKDADSIAKTLLDGCFIEKQNEPSIKIS